MAAGVPSGVPPAPISSVDLTMDEATGQVSPGRTSRPSHPQPPPSDRIAPTAFDESVDEPPVSAHAPRWRTPAIVFLCFLLSVVVTSTVAYRMKLVAAAGARSATDAALARAEDALKRQRFDNPPGDNVRDLTNDALGKWPGDARFLGVRARACEAIVKEAAQRRGQGDLLGAMKLVQLARELDPTNAAAQQLATEYDALAQSPAPAALVPVLPDAGRAMASMKSALTGGVHKPAVASAQAASPPLPASAPPPVVAAPPSAAPAPAPAPSASVKWM
jgi:hypothetical protein